MTAAAAFVLLVGVQAPQTVSGIVRDAQDLPLAGARATLTCGDREQAHETGGDGGFVFERPPSAEGCTLRVERAGFDRVERSIDSVATGPLIVRLQIRVNHSVEVIAPQPQRSAFLSVTLAEADFRHLAATTEHLIDQARLLAGATAASVVYVDGLPATTLPPLTQIAAIRVNADPFSAEYADGDVTAVHIITKAPARVFAASLGTNGIELGGRDVLDSSVRSSSSSLSVTAGGPVPRLPLSFRFDGAILRRTDTTPVRAVLPPSLAAERTTPVPAENEASSAGLDVFYAAPKATVLRLQMRQTWATSTNAGAGGLTLPETASASASRSREWRATLTRASGRLLFEGGGLVVAAQSSTRANSRDIGVFIPGTITMGGAPLEALDAGRVNWTAKHVVRSSSDRPWSAGLTLTGSHQQSRLVPNERGQLQFESIAAYEAARLGAATGTLLVSRGISSRRYSNVTGAPFIQKIVARTRHVEVMAGVRADAQERFGVLIAPRLTVAGRWNALTVAGGSGVFARNIPDAAILTTIARDGRQLQEVLASRVSLAEPAPDSLATMPMLLARVDPDLARPREVLHRISIERRLGGWAPAVEYSWARESHRLGTDRVQEGGRWVDVLRSNRLATRHRLHSLIRYSRARQHISASYQWMRARDNGGGWFSFVERGAWVTQEWAPTAGLAPHTVALFGSFTLPSSISLHVSDSWASGAPYNITSGLDVDGNGLFVDRGGRPRNSGRGPAFHSVSLYGYRRVALPVAVRRHRLHLNVGVQVSNLLDARNITTVGAVTGSGSFGRPIAALPGRSIRTFLSLD